MTSADKSLSVPKDMTPEHARLVMRLIEAEREEAELRRGRWAVGGQLLSATKYRTCAKP